MSDSECGHDPVQTAEFIGWSVPRSLGGGSVKPKRSSVTTSFLVLVLLVAFLVFVPGIPAYLTKDQQEGLRFDCKIESDITP